MNARALLACLAIGAAAACSDELPPIGGELIVVPDSGYEDVATEIHIRGEAMFALIHVNFSDPASSTAELELKVMLGGVQLNGVHMIDRGVISAIVPAHFPRGEHTLAITDAMGRSITKLRAFRTEPMPIDGPPRTEEVDLPMPEPVASSAVCGDGAAQTSEGCDDGDLEPDDGCSPSCTVEDGWTCTGSPSRCVPSCGDGNTAGSEECDDQNQDAGDGCDPSCEIELGYACAGEPSVCSGNCGDGALDGSETCDDGAWIDGDGCSAVCAIEPGWTCPMPGSPCVTICGDGILAGGEVCDDGNISMNDGCNNTCTLEQGWTCPDAGRPCVPICGDGLLRGNEPCEDSNVDAGDGCSSTCEVEPGFDCSPSRTICNPICGDGLMRGAEVCDDGDLAGGDGCGANCTLEQGWTCPLPGLPCNPICGDGVTRGSESCDDSNGVAGDGCNTSCRVEIGYVCPTVGAACTPICGDGRVRGAEPCDDGDLSGGDGCSATCTIEDGFTCPNPGLSCIPICGNGLLHGSEQCDDGNLITNDGCSASCVVEAGYTCPIPGSACVGICGDGMIRGGEICDDGNTASNDGCDSVCLLEDGFTCTGPNIPCIPICGDQLPLGNEGCDDGNTTPNDGCSATCEVEPGYTCAFRTACAPTCGDGLLRGAEACDDGNLASNDGCNATCTATEVGWTCATPNAACTPICGDSRLLGGETCDDGNTNANDGCGTTCTIEQGWSCPAGVCAPICGDSLVRGAEACDDGNRISGDGCAAGCTAEVGFACPPAGGACNAICGDGLVRGDEGCDDGNLIVNDGCNLACDVEASFDCSGSPSVCEPFCGNRRADLGEGCDDGNRLAGDGCSATCTLEAGFVCARYPSVCVAAAGTAVVDDGAVCPGSGTNALPYCSLANAVSAMTARIIIRPGEYRETIDLNTRTVDLIADDGALLIPSDSAASPALRVRGASTVEITGLTITGGTTRASLEGGNVSIALSQIGPGTVGPGIETSGNARLSLTQSRVSGNAGGGVALGGSTLFTLAGNIIANNGAAVGPQFGGVRVTVAPAGSRLINNTIVYNTSAAGTTAGVRCDVAGATMISSVVYGNSANTTASSASANCSPTYSSLTPAVAGTGNITGDPQLLAPNYSLLPASALIDAGDPAGIAPAGSAPAVEYDGYARASTDRPDIGAYEYAASRYSERRMTSLTTLDGGNYLARYQRGLFRGTNQVPVAHRVAGLARALAITPRAMDGSVNTTTGRYVMLTLGGSDMGQAYCTDDPMTPPNTIFPEVQVCGPYSLAGRWRLEPVEAINRTTFYHVNGAYPNQYAENFTQDDDVFPPIPADPFVATANGNYDRIRDHILPYYVPPGLSEAQVEILFVELYNRRPQASLPDRHSDVTELMVRLGNVIRLAKSRYPNLQMVFLTSRAYAGVNTVRGPGEPFAYETGLAVKALVEAQMAQMENGGVVVDPRAGNLNYTNGAAPWISWGPYLWANGNQGLDVEPRWSAGDFELANPNGYYTNRGIAKAELIMMRWFSFSVFTKCWIMANAACQ